MALNSTLDIPGCPYTKLEFLSQGSFGNVYKSKHPETGNWVAIKTFYRYTDSKKEVEALEKLIEKRLNSPNLVKFLGSFPLELGLVAVLEYCDGGDLRSYLKRGEFHLLSMLPQI